MSWGVMHAMSLSLSFYTLTVVVQDDVHGIEFEKSARGPSGAGTPTSTFKEKLSWCIQRGLSWRVIPPRNFSCRRAARPPFLLHTTTRPPILDHDDVTRRIKMYLSSFYIYRVYIWILSLVWNRTHSHALLRVNMNKYDHSLVSGHEHG